MSINAEWTERSLAHVWQPCTQMHDHAGGADAPLPLIPIKSAEGVWLEDYDGRRYLDAVSSWWTNLFGHRHPHIVASLKQQLDTLDHVIFAGFTHEPAIQLAEKLCAIAPKGLTRCFYADNGSAAVEVALKMSFHYWQNIGKPSKKRYIALTNGYHGETLGALAVGHTGLYRDTYAPLLMQPIFVPSPDCFERAPGTSWEDHTRRRFLEMELALEHYADEVCAVILEPLVQCAGGMRMYHPVYLTMLRAACDRHGVHLIADEIAVGFGRTGQMFACDWVGMRPDFLCLSKGLTGGTLPLACVLTREHIYDAFYAEHKAGRAFLHSHSYTGNPLACRAALATMEVFAQEDWLSRIRLLGQYLWTETAPLRSHRHVADVRQQGLILAIELAKAVHAHQPYPASERRGLRVYRHALKANKDFGVLLRPLGDVIYFMPPYTIEPREIQKMVKIAIEAIDVATGDS
ncbi:MAG: adenosylmethionine--8-amino-7-oxononanoate transaminase [Panacagrimonas sp.]